MNYLQFNFYLSSFSKNSIDHKALTLLDIKRDCWFLEESLIKKGEEPIWDKNSI